MVANAHQLEGLRVGAQAAVQLQEQARRQPLTVWRAWDAPQPATSQVRALRMLGTRETCFFGGNRCGKTVLARLLAVCFALGGDHPAVRMLLEANGITDWDIPDGPGEVFMVALTSDASREYHREEIADLLPPGAQHWHNRNGKGVAYVKIDVPGYEKKARIWFKSCDAGRRAMQGSSVRLVIFDEEPPEDVYNEAKMRVLDQAGRIVLSMTPLMGQTWVYHKLAQTPETEQKRCHWLDITDNPHLPEGEAEAVLAAYDDAEREARQSGRFITLEGRIYTKWMRSVHVCEPFVIPEDWPRFRGIDFGTRNPFCCLWAAMSPDDVLYVYREYYQPEKTVNEHAGVMLSYKESIAKTWADPEDPGAIKTLRKDHGMVVQYAKKDVRKGIDKVKSRLVSRRIGGPGLVVFRTCSRLINEFENYVWLPESKRGEDPADRPWKKDDHGMDAVRYIVMGVDRPRVAVAS